MTNRLVVVLGKCGRNFRRRNEGEHASVRSLMMPGFRHQALQPQQRRSPNPLNEDFELLSVISPPRRLTWPVLYRWILESWEQALPKFVKIFPREYKRILSKPRAMEVAHG